MTPREVIEQYILWRQAHGAKFTTGANLLRHFLRYADGDGACDAVTTTQVLAFLSGKGPLARHRENKYYVLAGFWRYAISRGHATRSPLPDSEPKSPPRTPPYIYSRDELRRLFDPTNIEISRRGSSGDSSSLDTISSAPIQSISASGTLADMTPELAKSAAEALRQQISNRPKSGSRRSSRPPPAARTG